MTTPASKLLQPITVGPLELKNRIMFPPLTTGYEERDGSIGERSLAFYERLARGGVSYIVIGDVAPVMTASPTPKLATDAQIPTFKALADAVHKHGAKVALQLFHPEYDVPGVGRMVMGSMAAAKAAQEAKAAGDEETFAAKMAESNEIRKQAYAKLLPRIHNGAIVLLHSTSSTNAAILDDLLSKWEDMGYRFAPLTELSAPAKS